MPRPRSASLVFLHRTSRYLQFYMETTTLDVLKALRFAKDVPARPLLLSLLLLLLLLPAPLLSQKTPEFPSGDQARVG